MVPAIAAAPFLLVPAFQNKTLRARCLDNSVARRRIRGLVLARGLSASLMLLWNRRDHWRSSIRAQKGFSFVANKGSAFIDFTRFRKRGPAL